MLTPLPPKPDAPSLRVMLASPLFLMAASVSAETEEVAFGASEAVLSCVPPQAARLRHSVRTKRKYINLRMFLLLLSEPGVLRGLLRKADFKIAVSAAELIDERFFTSAF